jgi:four helix bundle protein
MSRDYRTLRVFEAADVLVIDVYQLVQQFPRDERYGLQSQVRRAAVSVATNIVEGSVRRSERSWAHYLEIALGSACEVRYLLDLSVRLRIVAEPAAAPLRDRYSNLIAGLQKLISTMPAGQSHS